MKEPGQIKSASLKSLPSLSSLLSLLSFGSLLSLAFLLSLVSFLSLSSLPSFAEPKCELIFSQDFESTPCGRLPKGLNDNWRNRHPTNEMCRYVTNVDAATGERSLMCDFSQLKAGSRVQRAEEHQWLAWRGDDRITNGWIRWSMSVKRLSGEMSGEIRTDIGSRADPKRRRNFWIAYWLRFGEAFTVRNEAQDTQTVSVGALPRGRWCKVDLVLPLPANPSTNAYGRVSVKGPDGTFRPGPRVAIPLGDMSILRGYNLMQIGGGGTAKWLVDDISVTHLEK